MSIKFFDDFGKDLKARWLKCNLDEESLPDLAARALHEARPHEHVAIDEVISHVLSAEHLLIQPNIDYDFGTPPLAVFSDEKFLVELLFWLDGLTGIHQHWFSGAFGPLVGSSLHTQYEFDVEKRINSRLAYGELRSRQEEVLVPGDARPIHLAEKYIHSVYHLDFPTVSVVVRTPEAITEGPPPFSYHPPGLARVPAKDQRLKRQAQFFALSARLDRQDFEKRMTEYVSRADCYSTFEILWQLGFEQNLPMDQLLSLLAVAEERHGDLFTIAHRAMGDIVRQSRIAGYRAGVNDKALRTFLAVLVMIPSRSRMIKLLKSMGYDEPRRSILEWAETIWRSNALIQWDEEQFKILRQAVMYRGEREFQVPTDWAHEISDYTLGSPGVLFRNLLIP